MPDLPLETGGTDPLQAVEVVVPPSLVAFLPDVFFLLLFALLVTETALSLLWYAPYYRFGPVAFRRRIVAPQPPSLTDRDLTSQFRHASPPLIFRQTGPDEIAFRAGYQTTVGFQTRPRAVLRGLIRLDRAAGEVVVLGRVYWSALALPVAFASQLLRAPGNAYVPWLLLVLLLALLAYIYWRNVSRWQDVVRHLEHQTAQAAGKTS